MSYHVQADLNVSERQEIEIKIGQLTKSYQHLQQEITKLEDLNRKETYINSNKITQQYQVLMATRQLVLEYLPYLLRENLTYNSDSRQNIRACNAVGFVSARDDFWLSDNNYRADSKNLASAIINTVNRTYQGYEQQKAELHKLGAEHAQEKALQEQLRQQELEAQNISACKQVYQHFLTSWDDSELKQAVNEQLVTIAKQINQNHYEPAILQQQLLELKTTAEAERAYRQLTAKIGQERTTIDNVLAEIKALSNKVYQEQVSAIQAVLATTDISEAQQQQLQQQVAHLQQLKQQVEYQVSKREYAYKAVRKQLKKVGFTITATTLNTDTEVITIVSQRPQGSSASFKLALDGDVSYKFDGYKGKSCTTDIDQVLPDLEKVYGIKLSDEHILWENPDDVKATHKPIASTNSMQASNKY